MKGEFSYAGPPDDSNVCNTNQFKKFVEACRSIPDDVAKAKATEKKVRNKPNTKSIYATNMTLYAN